MSLSITQQKIKGGHEVLMVRDGSIRLLTFPLSMRSLAQEMCLEGNELDEEQYPVLVKKYQGKRLEMARKPAQSTTHWTPPIQPVVGVEQELERIVIDDPIAALLTVARKAETRYLEADVAMRTVTHELFEAKDAADEAWRVFNEALHASMPDLHRVRGIAFFDEPVEWRNTGRTASE